MNKSGHFRGTQCARIHRQHESFESPEHERSAEMRRHKVTPEDATTSNTNWLGMCYYRRMPVMALVLATLFTTINIPLAAAQSCIPLANSTTCPAFSAASVVADSYLVSLL